jgi:hypothetical protein
VFLQLTAAAAAEMPAAAACAGRVILCCYCMGELEEEAQKRAVLAMIGAGGRYHRWERWRVLVRDMRCGR